MLTGTFFPTVFILLNRFLLSSLALTTASNPQTSFNDIVTPTAGAIGAGQSCTTLSITINDDTVTETDETFILSLSTATPGGIQINPDLDTYTVIILANDGKTSP